MIACCCCGDEDVWPVVARRDFAGAALAIYSYQHSVKRLRRGCAIGSTATLDRHFSPGFIFKYFCQLWSFIRQPSQKSHNIAACSAVATLLTACIASSTYPRPHHTMILVALVAVSVTFALSRGQLAAQQQRKDQRNETRQPQLQEDVVMLESSWDGDLQTSCQMASPQLSSSSMRSGE